MGKLMGIMFQPLRVSKFIRTFESISIFTLHKTN